MLKFERVDLDIDLILYKVTADKSNYYLGEITGHGVEIVDTRKLPEEVVLDIIRSIEFKQHE